MLLTGGGFPGMPGAPDSQRDWPMLSALPYSRERKLLAEEIQPAMMSSSKARAVA